MNTIATVESRNEFGELVIRHPMMSDAEVRIESSIMGHRPVAGRIQTARSMCDAPIFAEFVVAHGFDTSYTKTLDGARRRAATWLTKTFNRRNG